MKYTWIPRIAPLSIWHFPPDKSQRRRSGNFVKSGSERMECLRILGQNMWSFSIYHHDMATRVSYNTCTTNHSINGKSMSAYPISQNTFALQLWPAVLTRTQTMPSGSTPARGTTRRGLWTNHYLNLFLAKQEILRFVRSSQAPCILHKARCLGWKLQEMTAWCPSVREGATIGSATAHTQAWRS